MRCNRHDAAHYHKCEKCLVNDVPKPKRICGKCISKINYKVTILRDGNKGRNARGIASRKPDKSRIKVVKPRTSIEPKPVTAYRMNPGR